MDTFIEQLNILANNITTIGDAILTEAAVLVSQTEEENENLEIQLQATNLNILGSLIVLIGDFISAALAQNEIKKNIEEGKDIDDADRLDVAGSWLSVTGDYLSYLAAVKEGEEKEV